MRKIKFSFVLLPYFIFLIACSGNENISDTENKLPKEILDYTEKHFPDVKIIRFKKDPAALIKTYDVYLEGKIELEFDSKNRVLEIESKTKLPNDVIPVNILSYVQTNYPENYIIEWKQKDRRHQVELNNDLKLEFNWSGRLIKVQLD